MRHPILLGLLAALLSAPAAAETAPKPAVPPIDAPGLGLDKIAWGMTAAQIKAAYPFLGAKRPDKPDMVLEAPELATSGFEFAGCRYDLGISIVPDWMAKMPPHEPEGAAEILMFLQPDQPADCEDKAAAYITGLLGPPLRTTRQWDTAGTEIWMGSNPNTHIVNSRFMVRYDSRERPLFVTRS